MQLFHLLMLDLSVAIIEHLTSSNSKIAVPESGCDVYLTSNIHQVVDLLMRVLRDS